MTTGKIVVMFNEDYTLMDRIQWKLWHKDYWRLTDVKWIKDIDGSSDIGYIAPITGNRFVVKLLERHSKRKYPNYFTKS